MKPVLILLAGVLAVGCGDVGGDLYKLPDIEDTDTDTDTDTGTDADSDTDTDADADTETDTDTQQDTDTDTDTGDDTDTGPDTETDTGPDTGYETDTDTGTDTDTDTDTGAPDACTGPGVYLDAIEGVCWENPAPVEFVTQAEAAAHCAGLELGGYDDWELPTVNQLTMLSTGCEAAIFECAVSDPDCLTWTCAGGAGCDGCGLLDGPSGGCYWPAAMGTGCEGMIYRSSSVYYGSDWDGHWAFGFYAGVVLGAGDASPLNVRCARPID